MIYPKNRNIHRPAHLYLDKELYFITARTLGRKKHFSGDLKELIRQSLKLAKNKYQFKLYAWAILDNHYHLLLEVVGGDNLPRIVRYINARSARLLRDAASNRVEANIALRDAASSRVKQSNKITELEAPSRRSEKMAAPLDGKIWYQYREKVVDTEKKFYTYYNYIHLNPFRHGFVKNVQALLGYKFCSYQTWRDKLGQEVMDDIIGSYPVEACELEDEAD